MTTTHGDAMNPIAPPRPRFRRLLPAATAVAMVLAPVALTADALPGQQERLVGTSNDWAITPELRVAVDQGLDWLAEHQSPAGYWGQNVGYKLNNNYEITAPDAPHIGVTALALMSFMAGGHLPGRGKYGDNLDRGLEYVLRAVRENGFITDYGSRMYSHAFATLFLAEVYGMTYRANVRRALQQAVNLIVDSQNSQGGWRYKPFARESDMSITVCQVIALRSARNVGIHVPFRTIERAQEYVYKSAIRSGSRNMRSSFLGGSSRPGAFRYQLRPNSRSSLPLTAAGVTSLFASGEYDSQAIRDGLDFMDFEQVRGWNGQWFGHYFFYYGHYYAVQAYYIAGGERWRNYFKDIRGRLLSTQNGSGSWPCRVGPGESFSTAVSTLILQIPLGYLPIFQR